MSSTIESVLQEKRVFPPAPAFVKQANISGMEAYRALVADCRASTPINGRSAPLGLPGGVSAKLSSP